MNILYEYIISIHIILIYYIIHIIYLYYILFIYT